MCPGKEAAPEVEMSIPGLDWGMDEVMGKDTKKVPQKKVPYAKPIPAQFQQVIHLPLSEVDTWTVSKL